MKRICGNCIHYNRDTGYCPLKELFIIDDTRDGCQRHKTEEEYSIERNLFAVQDEWKK